jgi:putative restriction endonuclease
MKIWVGVTDNEWFRFLAARQPDEVNFWRPGGTREFHAIPVGAPFLFKLHSPLNYIAGGGFFLRHSVLPLSIAWEAFGEKNGTDDYGQLLRMINRKRGTPERDPVIGCTILAEPFFLPESEWIPVPASWASNIVSGKTYALEDSDYAALWDFAMERARAPMEIAAPGAVPMDDRRYGEEYIARARLGQGAFRILVMDAYQRRCSMTGEKVLPVLQAAHIRPFAEDGPHRTSNGMFLRSDLHVLFDQGYMTVSPGHRIEVSGRLREDFNNGKHYYELHGQPLVILPDRPADRPAREYLDWHNEQRYLG